MKIVYYTIAYQSSKALSWKLSEGQVTKFSGNERGLPCSWFWEKVSNIHGIRTQ